MLTSVWRQLRPRQWVKNLILFAGLIFARAGGEPRFALRAFLGFAAFCLISSSVYVVNDWLDRELDRLHQEKRHRPIASGKINGFGASLMVAVLLGGAAFLAAGLGAWFLLAAGAYLVLNLGYSLGLKQLLIVDVLCIASGFVIRAIAGVSALRPLDPAITISPWLLVCTFFGALLLGAIKRRQELALVGEDHRRAVLKMYSLPLLDDIIRITAACTLFAYALYTIAPATVQKFHTESLVFTIPFVVYGIFRYLYLTRARSLGENPTEVLLRDRPLLVNVLLWLVAVVLIVYTPWSAHR